MNEIEKMRNTLFNSIFNEVYNKTESPIFGSTINFLEFWYGMIFGDFRTINVELYTKEILKE